ncbi:MAG: hypothetical protein D6765_07930, partial [Bacteroidetes bacterium]
MGQGQNLSEERIRAQIEVLNEDFAAINEQYFHTPFGWDSIAGVPNIEFCLAEFDPAGNPTNGITRDQMTVTGTSWTNNNIRTEIMPALSWDPLHYYNVYVLPIPGTTADGGVVGFANYPTPGVIGNATDGAVVDYRWFGGPGFGQSGYRTLTHETGHYLGVLHPFAGNSCSADDGIDDTPNVEKATQEIEIFECTDGYPTPPQSCGNEHLYVNFMDYQRESCYTSFTHGQVNVMRAVLDGTAGMYGYGSRQALVNNAAAVCTLPGHDAGIARIAFPGGSRLCTSDSIQARVLLRNFGTEDLSSAIIQLNINGNLAASLTWSGSLFPGESEEVVLPPTLPPHGNTVLEVFTSLPNGMADARPANDTARWSGFTALSTFLPLTEDFESETDFPTVTGIVAQNLDNDDFAWEIAMGVSAFGQGLRSALFDNFAGTNANNPFGTADALITRHYDFSNVQGATLSFNVAYAPYSPTLSDTLLVLAAADCAPVFDQVLFLKGGEQLATAPSTTDPFTPTDNQWRTETIDLSAFDGAHDVIFAFVNLSSWGNRLFLDNIEVSAPCNLSLQFTTQDATCFAACDAAATVHPSGGSGDYTFVWGTGAGNQSGPTASGLCAGTYSVTVSDAGGCSVSGMVSVGEPAPLQANATSTDESAAGANDGTASANPTGGTPPYQYAWSNGSTQATLSNLSPGSYSLTVTDAQGCTATSTVTVASFDCSGFEATLLVQEVRCHNGADGMLSVQHAGATEPVSYQWSTGAGSSSIGNLPPGTYLVTLTDASNCEIVLQAELDNPPLLEVGLQLSHESSPGANDGSASANPQGGVPPYTYQWSTGATSQSITSLAPGTYSLTVTDARSCQQVRSFDIQAASCNLSLSLASAAASCPDGTDG